jgi:GNAT superfamily N-acetyltransferase
MPTIRSIERLTPDLRSAGDRVLARAFARYPVMQFVLGESEPDPGQVSQLVTLFTSNRWLRAHPVYGIRDDTGALAGVVTLTPAGDHETPAELPPLLDRLWSELGDAPRRRYEMLRAAWEQTEPTGRRWHVNMIGVTDAARGAGFGSLLLRRAIEIAHSDPTAEGIDLTTEHARNLPFYESHGFTVVDSARINSDLETWILVRDRDELPSD